MEINFKKYLQVIIYLFLLGAGGYSYAETIPFDSDRWQFIPDPFQFMPFESTVKTHLDQQSLALNQGYAIVKDSEFTDGIIEYDIALTPNKGYGGAIWHAQGAGANNEMFYLRSHQSGNPDSIQYTPTTNAVGAWQLYKPDVSIEYPFNEWIHVKTIIAGKNAEVYIQDMETPAVVIILNGNTKSGQVGLQANIAMPTVPIHFANFNFTPMDNPPLKLVPQPVEIAEGTVMSWIISDAFKEESLNNKFRLTEEDRQQHTWTELASENSGLANLAKIQGIQQGNNTVFARITIVSEQEQIKLLKYGFSDKAKVYFNGQLIGGGSDIYRSRDYRFLGTIGYYDDVYLPLKAGSNELWIAISEEDYGGWAVQARFENMAGIKEITTIGQRDLNSQIDPNNSCTANYSLDGNLHIPCISVPVEGSDTNVMFEADMKQQTQPPFIVFGVENVKPR